jgi:hypothetical protein
MTTVEPLATQPNFADPDAAYRLIAQAHRDLGEAESAAFNARLALILANHIGDMEVLRQALALAREAS